MVEIVFKHHRRTENIGDAVCSPYDYLTDWPSDAIALDLADPTPPCRAVIYGGGKIMGGLSRNFGPNDLAARYRIAWGVSTVQTLPFSLKYWRAFKRMSLVGSRDWGDRRFDFAPCATCLSPEFDRRRTENVDVVAYLHHWRSPKGGLEVPPEVPCLDNTCSSLREAIDFLGRGRIVVSNSYHGVYWALLLGKKVLCLPFSKKFLHYRVVPGYADPETWRDSLHLASGSDEMLELCREASTRFAARVRDHLSS